MTKVKILIPVYNDWQSVSKLIDEIDNLSIISEYQISVIIVTDASNHDRQDEDKIINNIHSIKINFIYLVGFNNHIYLYNFIDNFLTIDEAKFSFMMFS